MDSFILFPMIGVIVALGGVDLGLHVIRRGFNDL